MNSLVPHEPSITYRPDIDGLRAIAVTAVVLNHAGISCPGGYVGVDIFFVISGYLITSLILRDLDSGKFHAAEFWERRVRRILPALIVCIAAVFAMAWVLYLPWDFERLGSPMMSQAVAASNFVHWSISGYFAPDADTLPLLHTWSLAVEEQFYILLPLILWITFKWRRSWVKPLLIVGFVVSLAACLGATKRFPGASFYLLPTRAWELLTGSILASGLRWDMLRHRLFRQAFSLVGLAAIGWAIITYDSKTSFPGAAAMLPTFGTMAIIWANEYGPTQLQRVLAWSPLVFIGKISYSLYLIHWPLIVFVQYRLMRELATGEKIALVIASYVLAVVSWAVVETPLRQKKILSRRAPLFLVSAIAMATIAAIGFWTQTTGGMPSRFTPQQLRYMSIPDKDNRFGRVEANEVLKGHLKDFGSKEGPVECVVWGDSHAMSLMPAIDEVCREKGIHGAAAMHGGTAPLIDFVSRGEFAVQDSPAYSEAVVRFAREHKVRYVILVAYWTHYSKSEGFNACFEATAKQLASEGFQVTIVRDVAKQSGNVPRLLTHALIMEQDVGKIGIPYNNHRKAQATVDHVMDQITDDKITILDPVQYLMDDKKIIRAEMDGVALYRDDNHLSNAGAMRVKPMFESVLHK